MAYFEINGSEFRLPNQAGLNCFCGTLNGALDTVDGGGKESLLGCWFVSFIISSGIEKVIFLSESESSD